MAISSIPYFERSPSLLIRHAPYGLPFQSWSENWGRMSSPGASERTRPKMRGSCKPLLYVSPVAPGGGTAVMRIGRLPLPKYSKAAPRSSPRCDCESSGSKLISRRNPSGRFTASRKCRLCLSKAFESHTVKIKSAVADGIYRPHLGGP